MALVSYHLEQLLPCEQERISKLVSLPRMLQIEDVCATCICVPNRYNFEI